MTLVIDDELEKRFREAIFKTYGMKRGNIQQSIEEALELWIEEKSMQKKDNDVKNR